MGWTLVTGGGKRLGADICLALAQLGYDIIVHYNKSEHDAWKVVEECQRLGVQAHSIQGDFSTAESTQRFIAHYLKLYPQTANLINNVGNYATSSALQTPASTWTDLFQTNLHAPIALIQALTLSIKSFQGNIINLGVAGLETGYGEPAAAAYKATKLSLWLVTRALAKELSSSQVRVNMVSPGYLDISVDLPSTNEKFPMKRPGKTEEIARVVAFLLDPASGYITGQNIEVAGGIGL